MDMNQLTRIFCDVDDFCKELNRYLMSKFLLSPTNRRDPACCLSDSEIMMILILFQSSRWRDFKNYYNHFLSTYYKSAFPNLPSYNRLKLQAENKMMQKLVNPSWQNYKD